MEAFCQTYEQLVWLLHSGPGDTTHVLMMEPFVFPYPGYLLHWIPTIQEMSSRIRQIAHTYQDAFLPLHEKLNQAAAREGLSAITVDGVHLTKAGHTILAKELLGYLQSL